MRWRSYDSTHRGVVLPAAIHQACEQWRHAGAPCHGRERAAACGEQRARGHRREGEARRGVTKQQSPLTRHGYQNAPRRPDPPTAPPGNLRSARVCALVCVLCVCVCVCACVRVCVCVWRAAKPSAKPNWRRPPPRARCGEEPCAGKSITGCREALRTVIGLF